MANGIGKRLRAWLARPYPLWRGAWLETRFVVIAAALATAIVHVTRPFGLASLSDPSTLIVQLGSACLVAALLLRVAVPALLERRWDESRWTVGWQVAWEVLEVVVVAGTLMAVLAWNGLIDINATRARSFVAITALCAVAPVIVRTLLTERWLRRRNETQAGGLPAADAPPDDAPPGRLIRARDGAVELAADELRYVHAEENYVDVVFVRDGERSHRLLRVALAGVERQFNDGSVVQCHRSYLVALAAVAGVRGNAQGFRLVLRDLAETVPVSRSRAKAVLALIAARPKAIAVIEAVEAAPDAAAEPAEDDSSTEDSPLHDTNPHASKDE